MSLLYNGDNTSVIGFSGTFSGPVIIPSGVTSIGASAFQNCTSLTSITISSTVTSIGDNAFWGSGLTSITIPSSVTSIGELVFNICYDLSSVVINGPITTLPRYTFNGCSGLKTVVLPSTLTTIGDSAFGYCTSLVSLTIPNSVTSIGSFCFYMDTSLSSITLSTGLTNISSYCFTACSSLSSITLPVGLLSIGDYAFNQCTALTSVLVPSTVTSLGVGLFSSCTSLTYAYVTCNATSLPNQTFNGCSSLIEAFLPSTVLTIGDSAFGSCPNLVDMVFPPGTTSIGDFAFYQASSLTNISIPSTLLSIGDHCFSGCTNLVNLDLPDGLTTIKDWAFQGCTKFTDITVPSTVSTFGDLVFNSCSGLRTVYLDASIQGIPASTFTMCTSLTNLRISSPITYVGANSFSGCSSLLYVGIPSTVTEIRDYAFTNCSNLSFVSLPYGLLSIGDHTFSGCPKYKNIQLPSTLTTIKEWAFALSTDLKYITIPSSITNIESNAFAGCSSLQAVYFEGNAPTIGTNVFGSSVPVYYKPSASGWNSVSGYNTISSNDTEPIYGGLTKSSLSSNIIVPIVNTTTTKITFSSNELSGVSSLDPNASSSEKGERVKAVTSYLLTTLLDVQQGKDIIIDTSSLPFPVQITSSKIQIAPAGSDIGSSILNSGYAVYSPLENSGDTFTIQSSVGPIVLTNTGSGYTASENGTVYNVSLGDIREFGGIKYIIGSVVAQKTGIDNNLALASSYTILYSTQITTNDTIVGYDGSINGIITIPTGTKFISSSAFLNATGITGIVFPSQFRSIGTSAFSGCTGLTSLDLSVVDTSMVISSEAFKNCTSLSSLTLPTNIAAIGSSVFLGCTALTSVNNFTSYSVRTIISGMFALSGLTSLTIPSNVVRVNPSAFFGCVDLSFVEFMGDAPSMGANAIPTTTIIKYYGSSTNNWDYFKTNYPQYTYVDLEGGYSLTFTTTNTTNDTVSGFTGDLPQTLNIPSGVKYIASNVFQNQTNITSINFPSTLETIGDSTFSGCSGLTSISLSSTSLSSLGASAFNSCSSLASITLPSTLLTISSYCFENCSSLVSITIPVSVTDIPNSTFNGCSSLTTITFNGDAPTVGSNAIPNGITIRYYGASRIGWDNFQTAFASSGFTYVNLEANVFTLLYSTFQSSNDTVVGFNGSIPSSLVIPSGVKYIDGSVFANQTLITSVSFPSSLISIGISAFSGCSGITSINISSLSGITILDNAFYGCTSMTSISLPNSITLGDGVLSGCTGLTTVNIPTGISDIPVSMFDGCTSLRSLTIPANITSINNDVFNGCTSLTLTFNGNAPTLGTNSIPSGTTIRYRGSTRTGWDNFKSTYSSSGFNFVNLDENNSGGNNQMSSFTVPVLTNYATTADISLNEATETVDICDALITFRTSGTVSVAEANAIFSYDWVDNDVTAVHVDKAAMDVAMTNCVLAGLRTWVGEKYEADVEQSTATPLGSRVEIDSGMVQGLRDAVAQQIKDVDGEDVLLSLFRQAPQLFPKYQTLSVPASDASFNAADNYVSSEDATKEPLDFSVGDKFYLVAKLRVSPSAVAKIAATTAVDASSGNVPDQTAANSYDQIFTISSTNITFGDISGNPIVTASAAGETLTDFQEYYVKITVTVA